MATLWITEFNRLERDGDTAVQIPMEPANTDQTVTFTSATQSSAFGATTHYIRLYPSADCHVAFGANPTATAAKQKLKAEVETYRAVRPGDKLSVYDGSS